MIWAATRLRGRRMPRTVVKLRRAGLFSIGALCVLAGLGFVYALVRPGVLGQISTIQLAMVAGLLVWPGLTYFLLRVDNLAIRRGRSVRGLRVTEESAQDGAPDAGTQPRSAA